MEIGIVFGVIILALAGAFIVFSIRVLISPIWNRISRGGASRKPVRTAAVAAPRTIPQILHSNNSVTPSGAVIVSAYKDGNTLQIYCPFCGRIEYYSLHQWMIAPGDGIPSNCRKGRLNIRVWNIDQEVERRR